jgi:ABC-type sugar transport system ATPase subunit
MVEIAKALYTRSKVIIMDEPTAALSASEVQRLHDVIREIAASGIAIIYISHALEEALALADRVTVLRDGEVAACRSTSELCREDLVHLMVGQHVEIVQRPTTRAKRGAELVRTMGLCWRDRVRDASFSLYAGEIVGLAGLIGSGRTEVASLLAGINRPDGGQIFVRSREVDLRSPRDALGHGIAILTENRKEEGLFLPLSVAHNLTIGILSRLRGIMGLLSPAREREEARAIADRLRLSTPSLQIDVRSLSGGNQQKLLIGRMLVREPDILIFDEPTKGVDVGAIAEIHHLIRELASRGKGILVISSYLPEIMALSDRILVMRGGEIVQDIDAADASTDAVISRAFV